MVKLHYSRLSMVCARQQNGLFRQPPGTAGFISVTVNFCKAGWLLQNHTLISEIFMFCFKM